MKGTVRRLLQWSVSEVMAAWVMEVVGSSGIWMDGWMDGEKRDDGVDTVRPAHSRCSGSG